MIKLLAAGAAVTVCVGAYIHYMSLSSDLDQFRSDLIVSEQSNNMLREAIQNQSDQLKLQRIATNKAEKVFLTQIDYSKRSIKKLRSALNENTCYSSPVDSTVIDSLPK